MISVTSCLSDDCEYHVIIQCSGLLSSADVHLTRAACCSRLSHTHVHGYWSDRRATVHAVPRSRSTRRALHAGIIARRAGVSLLAVECGQCAGRAAAVYSM